jgi:hypothetical protein
LHLQADDLSSIEYWLLPYWGKGQGVNNGAIQKRTHGLDALVTVVDGAEKSGTVALQSESKTALETGLLEKAG